MGSPAHSKTVILPQGGTVNSIKSPRHRFLARANLAGTSVTGDLSTARVKPWFGPFSGPGTYLAAGLFSGFLVEASGATIGASPGSFGFNLSSRISTPASFLRLAM